MGQASDLAQGWEERHKEFEDFELKFEVIFVRNSPKHRMSFLFMLFMSRLHLRLPA